MVIKPNEVISTILTAVLKCKMGSNSMELSGMVRQLICRISSRLCTSSICINVGNIHMGNFRSYNVILLIMVRIRNIIYEFSSIININDHNG
jgi:hypothetical protein